MIITGTLGALDATSASVAIRGDFDVSLSGFVTCEVELQRSFDGGSSWKKVKSYTTDTEDAGFSAVSQVLYRLKMVSWTDGTVTYFLGADWLTPNSK